MQKKIKNNKIKNILTKNYLFEVRFKDAPFLFYFTLNPYIDHRYCSLNMKNNDEQSSILFFHRQLSLLTFCYLR